VADQEELLDWLDQPKINRFSERMRTILTCADRIRSSQGSPAVSTLHLMMAFVEQSDGQLPDLLEQSDLSATCSRR
jgi:ClpA/ClpB-like protein